MVAVTAYGCNLMFVQLVEIGMAPKKYGLKV